MSIESVMPSNHSSSVVPFSSCLQCCPASGSFPMSQLFASGGQSIGASASTSVLPTNIQAWFPLGLTGLISLLSKGLLRVFSNTTVWMHQVFFMVHLSHSYMTTRKTIVLTIPWGPDKESTTSQRALHWPASQDYAANVSCGEVTARFPRILQAATHKLWCGPQRRPQASVCRAV